MEPANGNKLPFLEMMICKSGSHLTTMVHRKPTNTGLLLHFQSHVDQRYTRSLLKTMLNRAHRLSSCWDLFKKECEHLKEMFQNLKYPGRLIDSFVATFVDSVKSQEPTSSTTTTPENKTVRIGLPFKDQDADAVGRQLRDLSSKINVNVQPVYNSPKVEDKLKVLKVKSSLVNRQCVVYKYQCHMCDTEYISYTTRHLHQRIAEHKYSAVGKHLKDEHHAKIPDLDKYFSILRKCPGKLDCLIYEMLFIRARKPKLNTQSDSIHAKVFV